MLDFSNIQIGKKYDRPWLANKWGFRGYEAISRGVFCPRSGGQIILFVTRIKQESLEQYNDYISGEYLFWEGEKGHGNDHRIINSTQGRDHIHLFYREIHHSAFEYKGLATLQGTTFVPNRPTRFVFHLLNDQSAHDDVMTHQNEFENLAETERQSIIGLVKESFVNSYSKCGKDAQLRT